MDITVGGGRIHYEVEGGGEPVLLIHGDMQAGEDWSEAGYPKLLDGFKTVMVDQLGYGASDKPHNSDAYTLTARVGHLDAVLDAAGIGRVHVWGYSFGSIVAEAYARLRPERTRSLIVGGMLPGLKAIDRLNISGGVVPVYAENDWSRVWTEVYPDFDDDVIRTFQSRNDLLACAASFQGSFEPIANEDDPIPTPLLCYVGTGEWFWEGSREVTEAAGGTFVPVDGADHAAAFLRATEVVYSVRPFLLDAP